MNNAQDALKWITNLLSQYDIQYQIQGGLAAKAYGAKRDLADIDIDISHAGFKIIADIVKQYISYGPAQYKDDNWDLSLITLSYHGQEIDLVDGQDIKMFNPLTKEWMTVSTNFANSCFLDIFGINVPVIPCTELLAYKKILGREVDLIDIQEIENLP